MNNNVIGIGHVAYPTAQMDEMLHFYCDILSFENSFETKDENGKPFIQYIRVAESQFLELFYVEEKSAPKEGFYSHVCVQVSDIMSIDKLLKDNNIDVFRGPLRGSDKNWQCWAKDPDGNPIEFMQLDDESPQAKASRK